MYVGKYLFTFDDAILLGMLVPGRARHGIARMINDIAKSQIPGSATR